MIPNMRTIEDVWFEIYSISARLSNVLVYFFPEERWNLFAPPYKPEEQKSILDNLSSEIETLENLGLSDTELAEIIYDLPKLINTVYKVVKEKFPGTTMATLFEIKNKLDDYIRIGALKCKNEESFKEWYKIFKEILPNDLLKNILSFLTTGKQDNEEFIKRQANKLELYMNQLASNLITKEQFKGYVKDIQELTEMEKLKMQVAVKARAQQLIESIEDLILNRSLAFL